MKTPLLPSIASLSLLAAASAPAQQPVCAGNGLGQAYIEHTSAEIGTGLYVGLGSPAAPSGIAALIVADQLGPSTAPVLGTVCLDVSAPTFLSALLLLDGSGAASLTAPVPNAPALVNSSPLFATALTLEGSPASPLVSISKTVRISWENRDGYRSVGTLQLGRSLHRATSLARSPRDSRTAVLITGGGGGNLIQPVATSSSDLYLPLERRFVAGPAMAEPRAFHTSTRLQDGRVLITGGVGAGGVVTAGCEIYDPSTGAFAAAASMTTPRAGHAATPLPDGRVLISGGLNDYVNAVVRFGPVLNSAQDTAEVFDPGTGTWTATAQVMASKRSGHAQVLLASGRVLLISGIDGAVRAGGIGPFVPTYTASCEVFDPASGMFSPAANVGAGRAFFGSSGVAGGVLLTGGIVADPLNFGAAIATASCEFFDGTTWSTTGAMNLTRAFHTQVTSPRSGNALVHGGLVGDLLTLSGTAEAGVHNGTVFTPRSRIGTNPGFMGTRSPRGYHTLTLMYDGTYLLCGGTDQLIATDTGFVFIE